MYVSCMYVFCSKTSSLLIILQTEHFHKINYTKLSGTEALQASTVLDISH